MGKNLTFYYDKEGDILDIAVGKPVPAISEEVDDDFFVRVSPQTKEVVGFMILNFEKRFTQKKQECVPIRAAFQIAKQEKEKQFSLSFLIHFLCHNVDAKADEDDCSCDEESC